MGVIGYLISQNSELKGKVMNLIVTTTPSTEIIPTTKPTDDQFANWKTYYHQNLDISFKYPKDWSLQVGSYTGDAFLDFNVEGACKYITSSYLGYLKSPGSCSDSTIKTLSPGLLIKSPDGLNFLEFAGPTEGLGGFCEECTQNKPTVFIINGKYYTLNTVAEPSLNIKYETGIGPAQIGISAGSKSVWNVFDISLKAVDQSAFDTEIKILESIK